MDHNTDLLPVLHDRSWRIPAVSIVAIALSTVTVGMEYAGSALMISRIRT
jgi:hypothetical protein